MGREGKGEGAGEVSPANPLKERLERRGEGYLR